MPGGVQGVGIARIDRDRSHVGAHFTLGSSVDRLPCAPAVAAAVNRPGAEKEVACYGIDSKRVYVTAEPARFAPPEVTGPTPG